MEKLTEKWEDEILELIKDGEKWEVIKKIEEMKNHAYYRGRQDIIKEINEDLKNLKQ